MLYWAEGSKERNTLKLVNSDVNLIRFYRRFLVQCFGIQPEEFTLSLHLYTGNGLSLRQVEDYWLDALELPRSSLRGHQINERPTSSKSRRPNKLPYGVCTLRVKKSTWLVQHIYGAIQEYGDFKEPVWLD